MSFVTVMVQKCGLDAVKKNMMIDLYKNDTPALTKQVLQDIMRILPDIMPVDASVIIHAGYDALNTYHFNVYDAIYNEDFDSYYVIDEQFNLFEWLDAPFHLS
jgi:hypothetical protein